MGTGPVAATLARTAQRKASSLFAPTWRSTVSSCPGETRATSALVCCPSRRSSSSSLSARLSCARQVSSLACLLAASSRRPLATPRPPPSSLHLPSPSSGSRRSRSRSTAQLCFPCSPSTLLSLVRPLATSQPRTGWHPCRRHQLMHLGPHDEPSSGYFQPEQRRDCHHTLREPHRRLRLLWLPASFRHHREDLWCLPRHPQLCLGRCDDILVCHRGNFWIACDCDVLIRSTRENHPCCRRWSGHGLAPAP